MNSRKQRHPPINEDLEDTVELPNLPAVEAPSDAGAHTDTWIVPPFATATAVSEPAAAELVRVHLEQIGTLRSDLSSVAESRSRLEGNLQSLTTSLRELQAQLDAKGEELARLQREATEREQRLDELNRERVEGAGLRVRLERTETELAQVKQLREQQAAMQMALEHEHNARAATLMRAQMDLAEFRRRAAVHHESLQQLEGRRYIFDSMLREREQMLDERDAQAATLTGELLSLRAQVAGEQSRRDADASAAAQALTLRAEHDAQLQAARGRVQELTTQTSDQQQRLDVFERELGEHATRAAKAAEELSAAEGRHTTAMARIEELERDSTDHGDVVRSLQEQLRAAQLKTETVAGDLAAAEDLIRTAENELQQRDQRIAKLESNEFTLRSRLDKVGCALDERNALIERLEAEVASGAAVVGNMQRKLGRAAALDSAAPEPFTSTADFGAPALSGSHPVLDGQMRVLVRTEGDSGIVHRLGRRTTIGRTPDNDLCIDADFISRHHAVVLDAAGGTVIEDLNSTNGVFVNGLRVGRRQLAVGDMVTIGKTAFRFLVKPSP